MNKKKLTRAHLEYMMEAGWQNYELERKLNGIVSRERDRLKARVRDLEVRLERYEFSMEHQS